MLPEMEPRVRARHMKSLLAAVDRLPPVDAAAVSAHVLPATRLQVDDATGVDWLPVRMNVEVTRAVFRGLGEATGGRFFRETMRAAYSGPLLRVIIEAAQRVFRLDPASFAGWAGTGWLLVFRDCGRWTVVRAGEREATIRIEGLPAELAGDLVWLGSHAHSFEAFFDVAGATGTVRLQDREPALGQALYLIRWE